MFWVSPSICKGTSLHMLVTVCETNFFLWIYENGTLDSHLIMLMVYPDIIDALQAFFLVCQIYKLTFETLNFSTVYGQSKIFFGQVRIMVIYLPQLMGQVLTVF